MPVIQAGAFAVILIAVTAGAAVPILPEHSVSPSGQFLVYVEDNAARGAVSGLAETTKANLLSLLHVKDAWKTPIILNVQSARANVPELPPAALRFSQTGFGLKIQLDLTTGSRWHQTALEHELLRALLLEMIYRNEPNLSAGAPYVEPPAWLIDGLIASAPGVDRRTVVAALTSADKIVPLDEFLQQRRDQLDSPGIELYDAGAFALVQLLLTGENGRALFRYIQSLSQSSNDPLADLQRQFPELNQPDANTVWKTEIAKVKIEHEHQLFTFVETDRKLQDLIGSKISLRDLARQKLSPAERRMLIQLKLDLLLLAAHANPILRPTVQDYEEIAVALLTGKGRGVATRLSSNESLHKRIASRMVEIDDYMNWFEATSLTRSSGLFVNYSSMAKEQNEPAPHRHDPVSIYLDALEGQF